MLNEGMYLDKNLDRVSTKMRKLTVLLIMSLLKIISKRGSSTDRQVPMFHFLYFLSVMKWVIPLLLLTGCGLVNYHTQVYQNGKKVGEVKSNVPAKVETKDIKIDQRNETFFDKLKGFAPKTIKIEQ